MITTYHNQEYRKGLLRLGGSCNNECFFCHAHDATRPVVNLDTLECRRRIETLARAGVQMVVFSGGEPTIREDIIDLCRFAGEVGLKSGVITNGRMLCYTDFTKKLFDAGARYFLVSLHGDNEDIHNKHTCTNSFKQTMAGISVVSAYPVQLVINTVLTSHNAGRLKKILEIANRVGAAKYKVSLPEPRGELLNNFSVVLSPDSAASVANKLVASAGDSVAKIGFDGFTPCLLDNYFYSNDDFFTHGFSFVWNMKNTSFFHPDRGDRSHFNSCLLCSYYGICPGIYSEYLSVFPHFRLRPIHHPVSNSIGFEMRSSHPNHGEYPCTESFMSVLSPERWLALRGSGNLVMHSTNEIMTDTVELHKIKHDIEQVYLADNQKKQSFFNQEKLIKLRMADNCRDCKKKLVCPGVFERTPGQNPFDASMSHIIRLIEDVKGSVCEVGCGEGPLFNYVKKKQEEGTISFYLGIDPALPEACSSREESFVLKNIRFEDLKWKGKKFDFVVMFRSYNHMRDIGKGLKTLDAITDDGSIVIIAEDLRHIEIPVGGSPENKKALDFHHYINHSLKDAERLLNSRGFQTLEASPVTRDGACHWVLVVRKVASPYHTATRKH